MYSENAFFYFTRWSPTTVYALIAQPFCTGKRWTGIDNDASRYTSRIHWQVTVLFDLTPYAHTLKYNGLGNREQAESTEAQISTPVALQEFGGK